MTTNIDVLVLNTKQELQSFPLNQSIKLKFSEQVEDSQLSNCIALIRNLSESGLFNISEKYNQSIGYIREKFDVEDVKITTSNTTDGFVVTLTPVKPLSPGFEYTLFIDKNLSSEFISVTKPTSKSTSIVEAVVTNAEEADISLEIVSDPYITSTSNITKVLVTDHITNKATTIVLDLKAKSTYVFNSNISFKFNSTVYVKGEIFNVLSIPSVSLSDNLFVQIKTALTSNVKPLETTESFSSVSNETILEYYKNKVTKKEVIETNPKITYTGSNKFLIHLPDNITADAVDLDNMSYEISEAFGLYTLESYGLYCPGKDYSVSIEIKDNKTLLVTIPEA